MRTRPYLNSEGKVVRTKIDRFGGVCGKVRYAGKKIAKAAAAQRSKDIGEPLTAYRCAECHAFHLGHVYGSKRPRVDGVRVTSTGALDGSFRSNAERERHLRSVE